MKSLAKLMGNPSIAVLVIFLSCLAIVAGFLWQNQYISKQHQKVITQKQSHIAGIIHSAIENKIAGYNKQIAAVAESPQLATIIARQDPRLIASQQRALMRLFPQASQVCLIEASVDEPDPDACIPITFATLNSLRLAKKEGSAPVAIMQTTQEDAYLLLTQSIKDNNNKVMGILAITMPAKVVQKLLLPEFSTEGYIELQQPRKTGEPQLLSVKGSKPSAAGTPSVSKITGSQWQVAYWPEQAGQGGGSRLILFVVVTGLVVLLVVGLFWFLGRGLQRLVSADLATLVVMVRDARAGELKPLYPARTPDIVGTIHTVREELSGMRGPSTRPKPKAKPKSSPVAASADTPDIDLDLDMD